MAKRRRLTPPLSGYRDEVSAPTLRGGAKPTLTTPFDPEPGRPAPIARIAADAATSAAFDAVSDELRRARTEGRLVLPLPLDAVVEDYLVRDRIAVDEDELQTLMESLRARGQQTPIEVVDLGAGRFGLISGWRRLTALRRLWDQTGNPLFGSVLALLRCPAEASEAYVAMIEENEIRVGLSYYERARIVAKSVDQGVFPTTKQALQVLFSQASRAKRSKIGSFLTIVAALDPVIRFPSRLGERAGLALAKSLEEDAGLGPHLARRMKDSPSNTSEEELALLTETTKRAPRRRQPPATATLLSGIALEATSGPTGLRITLSGPKVDVHLQNRLTAWLRQSEA